MRCLYRAAACGSLQGAKQAINEGANIHVPYNGQTPLLLACLRENPEVIDMLEHLGAKDNMQKSANATSQGLTMKPENSCDAAASREIKHPGASCRCLNDQNANAEYAVRSNFPERIVEAMMKSNRIRAVLRTSVSVLFLDVDGFKELRGSMNPVKIVRLLERLFQAFDALAAHHCVECVDTFDGCYIAAANYSIPQPTDHAARLASFALAAIRIAALTEIDAERPELGSARLLAGMHCGSVCGSVVGVHGGRKHTLHGAAVNIASRMQSHGAPGVVQCSAAAAAVIETQGESRGLQLTRRGEEVDVKGLGRMRTFWLSSCATQTSPIDLGQARSYPACLCQAICTDHLFFGPAAPRPGIPGFVPFGSSGPIE